MVFVNRAKNKKGVFGLTSVQAFFAIVLAVALLAYVIVVIMGTLQESNVIPASSLSGTNDLELVFLSTTGTELAAQGTSHHPNCQATITAVRNSSTYHLNSANYTVVGCTFYNLTDGAGSYSGGNWTVNYTYTYDTEYRANSNNILANTSAGITGFFGAITPVYAILAVLVIILVLVVLVRVVTGGTSGGKSSEAPL